MSLRARAGIIAFSSLSFGLIWYGDHKLTELGISEWMAAQNISKSMFLTIFAGVWGSMLTHLSIIVDQVCMTAATKRIARTLTVVVLPANITITMIYWPLYLFFRHLIAQSSDFKMPLVTDMMVHLLPGATLLIYTLFFEDSKRAKMFGRDLCKYVLTALGYILWIEYKAYENHDKIMRYPYPFLNVTGSAGRVSIYVAATALLEVNESITSTIMFSALKTIPRVNSIGRIGLRSTATSFAAFRGITTKRFTKQHEYVTYDTDSNIGTVGITSHAQNSLGDVVFVELPTVGSVVKQSEQIGAVESVKAASDIYAPLAGDVEAVNEELNERPNLLNKSPEDEGWLCKLRVTAPEQLEALLNEDSYKAFTESLEE